MKILVWILIVADLVGIVWNHGNPLWLAALVTFLVWLIMFVAFCRFRKEVAEALDRMADEFTLEHSRDLHTSQLMLLTDNKRYYVGQAKAWGSALMSVRMVQAKLRL